MRQFEVSKQVAECLKFGIMDKKTISVVRKLDCTLKICSRTLEILQRDVDRYVEDPGRSMADRASAMHRLRLALKESRTSAKK